MKIVNAPRGGKTVFAISLFPYKCSCDIIKTFLTRATSLFYKNCKRKFSLINAQDNIVVKGLNEKNESVYVRHEKEIKEVRELFIADESSECSSTKSVYDHRNNNTREEVKEKLLTENLKKYNLFNIYLDKIRKPARTKKRKIININSVKHFDDCIYLFNLSSLLIYTKNKYVLYKRKKCVHPSDDYFINFFKIFVQLNIILNNFFCNKNEIKCNEWFTHTFQPYLNNIPFVKNSIVEEKYNEDFYLKILQIIKIINQIKFFKILKNINIDNLQNCLKRPNERSQLLIWKKKEENFFPNEHKNELFYEYMRSTHDEEEYNMKTDLNFVNRLKIFDDNFGVLHGIENYFNYSSYKEDQDKKKIKKKNESFLNEEEKNAHYYHVDIPTENVNSCLYNYFNKDQNVAKCTEMYRNKDAFTNCEQAHNKNKNDDNSNCYLSLVRGYSYILKNLIKYLNDDCLVRLFVYCATMYDKKYHQDNEILLFYKEMYEKIKKMKNITNKNLAYILNACNYYIKEENVLLIKNLQKQILFSTTYVKNNNKKKLNIYNIAPSHLENIIYTFSKNKIRQKEIFILFSEIVKEKCNGFSCVTSINILSSFTMLNYESLIFDFLYEKIKRFDIITLMMCKGTNIIKLVNTLLQIEERNFTRFNNNLIPTQRGDILLCNTCYSGNCENEDHYVETEKESVFPTVKYIKSALTDRSVYVTLILALLYELKMFKRNNCGSGTQEYTILNIYKKLLRLQIICVKNKTDFSFLKNIFKKNYSSFNITQFDKFFVFSFINLNMDKINFHKLIFTLLTYNNLISEANFTNKYTKKKIKFI
ncbi:hypothetical protein MKS88_004449 [Plasmodium brasilianum]|uniref:Uncharacterized protein n=2 Tax=Plasmodium (Plasmodium) TaxID=418103 RepID=A0A1A8W6K5_PLAMA|nr:conserved Plasmodium protein, unknown function [Plasmodium malariae]KAI4836650.1 hypothetical protein MKS88_004449 [Plasmodium brasilianum]SBS88432.1 conserved Plasmodium protein, unknown function [Plasmodium malariae]SCO93931.1 conserved Plasmodium protein, unknown function [Plasmodium malariae]